MTDYWVDATLRDVAEVNPREPALPEDAPFITMADVDEWGTWARTSGPRGTRGGSRARGGDVLVARITPCLENGKIAIVPAEMGRVGGSTEFIVLRAGPQLLPEFLFLWAVSQPTHAAAIGLMVGTTGRQRVNGTDVAALPISVPPLPVQRRIVDLMDHLDNHLANLRAEREAARLLLGRLREQLSVDVEMVPLGRLADDGGIQIGPFGSQLHANEYVDDGVPVVMPRDLVGGVVSTAKIKMVAAETAVRLSRHALRPGDIVFPRRGDLSKRALITDDQSGWLCGTGCIRYRPGVAIDGAQVFEAISGDRATDWLTEHAVGTTMLNLNTAIVSNLPVPDPRVGDSPVAGASSALALTISALAEEESALSAMRGATLSRLLIDQVGLPDTYDRFLEGVA